MGIDFNWSPLDEPLGVLLKFVLLLPLALLFCGCAVWFWLNGREGRATPTVRSAARWLVIFHQGLLGFWLLVVLAVLVPPIPSFYEYLQFLGIVGFMTLPGWPSFRIWRSIERRNHVETAAS